MDKLTAEEKAELKDRSNRYQSLVLDRARSVGQINIAENLDTSESTVFRALNPETLRNACWVISALGLKVVPQTFVCVDKPMYDAIITFAARAMQNPEVVQKLVWED